VGSGSGYEQYQDKWFLTVSSEVTVDIALDSNDFDAYVWITDASDLDQYSGNIAENDDGPSETTNSLIQSLTLSPGNYVIWAGSFDSAEVGSYQVSVTLSGS
jgi:hypothetical protein